MKNDPTLIGTVQDVSGATLRVAMTVETVTGLCFVHGEGYRIGQIGSFIRIPLGFLDLYGIVSQVGAGAAPPDQKDANPYGNRWLQVQLVGEGRRGSRFERGISQHPTIDDKVYIVTEKDLRSIYGPGEPDDFVAVGHLASAEAIPALVDINKLITRHAAVVGTTGSGKSTTVAGLLASLSNPSKYPSARIVVLDIHGEYSKALSDRATVFRVAADVTKGEKQLHIPYWALTFDEFVKISMGACESKELAGIQDRLAAVKTEVFRKYPRDGLTVERITVDSPLPFSVHQFWYNLHCEINSTHIEMSGQPQSRATWAIEKDPTTMQEMIGDPLKIIPPTFRAIKDEKSDPEKIRLSKSTLQIRRQVDTLASKMRDPRFDFLFAPGEWLPAVDGMVQKDLDGLLFDWIGGPQPISILDLSGIPSVVLNDLIGALLRILYDALFWSRLLPEGGRERPLFIVLEEAHAYLGKENSGAAASAVRRIAKEGRKYGVGMMLVSQRPSEVDSTILSQCGTIFAMRLANDIDRGNVTSAASDNLKGLFEMLPILRTGEAIIVGEAVSLPMRTLIEAPPKERRPDSVDPRVAVRGSLLVDGFESPGGWNQKRDKADYTVVVKQWRKQNPNYVHIQEPIPTPKPNISKEVKP